MYATHIFDGLEGWLTHLAFVSHGKLLKGTLLTASSMMLHSLCVLFLITMQVAS